MHWIAAHVAGGTVFFTGTALLLSAAGLRACRTNLLRRGWRLCWLAGLIAVSISATPLPPWTYAGLAVISLIWAWAGSYRSVFGRRAGRVTAVYVLAWLGAVAAEWPYHRPPAVRPAPHRGLVVLGDSLAAGTEDAHSPTWPRRLAQDHALELWDYSGVGATAATALRQAQQIESPRGVILVEIGGNDVLSGTPVGQFERDLEAVLRQLAVHSDCQRLMFELPLPPFYNSYGRVQRRLARRYNTLLIPKRLLVRVLASEEATRDSIHLSAEGHRLMAELVWRVVSPAYDQPDFVQDHRHD